MPESPSRSAESGLPAFELSESDKNQNGEQGKDIAPSGRHRRARSSAELSRAVEDKPVGKALVRSPRTPRRANKILLTGVLSVMSVSTLLVVVVARTHHDPTAASARQGGPTRGSAFDRQKPMTLDQSSAATPSSSAGRYVSVTTPSGSSAESHAPSVHPTRHVPVARASQPAYPPGARVIHGPYVLDTGERVQTGPTSLGMQTDGNLVLYVQGKSRWNSDTRGENVRAGFSADGNLRVMSAGGAVLWSSGTGGHSGAVLLVEQSGTMQIVDGKSVLWSAA